MISQSSRFIAALSASALCLGILTAVSAHGASASAVFVSEIVANNDGPDEFEWIEVHNLSDAAVDLQTYELAYIYGDAEPSSSDVALALDGDVRLTAHETVVLWLSYTNATGTLDSFARTKAEFRTHTGTPEGIQVVRVSGQPGMANGGNRGVRVTSPSGEQTRSVYPADSMGKDLSTTFRLPADDSPSYPVLATQATPSPGTLEADTLAPADQPTEPAPEPDPDLTTARLQITEVLPDSTNVGSADGYEFIEVYNATSEPIDFADYALIYLYPQNTDTNTNEAHWPSTPRDVVIDPAQTLVLWIKNGHNDSLTVADFNTHFGTEIAPENLVEIFQGGMANGSYRGLAVRTNTGYTVNRAYYNTAGADDTSADQGIRFGTSSDLSLQTLLGTAPATPGSVQADQVPEGLMVEPSDTSAPQIEDRTAAEIDPSKDFTFEFSITDDVQPRTATLELKNDVDSATTQVSLTGTDDTYTHSLASADITGKSWYEYTLTVTDGTNEVSTDVVRLLVAGANLAPVRLNVADGDVLAASTSLTAATDTYPPAVDLIVDGSSVPTEQSLEDAPMFVFEASQTDFYFRNGVRIGEDVLLIFDQGTYDRTETMSTPVPLNYLTRGEPLTVSVWAGSKAAPEIDEKENNDDFVISGMRLVLPDGRTLTPAGYDNPNMTIAMGDSSGKNDFYDSVFTIPDDAYTAVAHEWDTTAVADGPHEIVATSGDEQANATVQVDNTAPTITPSVQQGQTYQGKIVLDAEVTDLIAGVEASTATLNGEEIELGHTTSSVDLAAGDHHFTVTATDAVGNEVTRQTTFTTPEEEPLSALSAPADGAMVPAGDVTLRATVSDPTGDPLDVQFRQGFRAEVGDAEVTTTQGLTHDAAAVNRDGTVLTSPSVQAGIEPVTSDTALPYTQFDVAVPTEAGPGAEVRLTWEGTANTGSQVLLYALAADGDSWVEVDRHRTTADGEDISLGGTIAVGDHVRAGRVTALVQHSEGFAGPNLSDRGDAVQPNHPDDTPRSEYDFTIGWESDTQYYNEEFYEHQVSIHDYLLDQREKINLQYVIHTGDIVDNYDQADEWANANQQYARFDEAGLPYGVLAGNHDVGNQLADYSEYAKHFGAHRFSDNPWYGDSFEDNRGHYDLITAGGIDFLMLYMGWDPDKDDIAWMNEVLRKYPERVAIVNLHEFMLTNGGLGPIPQQIMDEVVATNPNVRMVFSGHYHDAFTRVDGFDDDGDGTKDRNVYSMLFDYQGLPEGGLGYLRLLQFDNEGEQMRVRTFSASENRYNSDEPSLLGAEHNPYQYQDFTLSYEELRITPHTKVLDTQGFTAEVLSEIVIEQFDQVGGSGGPAGQRGVARMPVPNADGSITLEATWAVTEPGEYGWFVESADPNGGVNTSRVLTFIVAGETGEGTAGHPSSGGAELGTAEPTDVGSESGGDSGALATTGIAPATLVTIAALLALLGALLRRRIRAV